MFKACSIILENAFYTGYNGILFYLQKIPLLGKIFKDKLYKVTFLGKFAVFMGLLFEFIGSIIKKIAYFSVIKYMLKFVFSKFDLVLTKEYLISFLLVLSLVGFVKTIDYFAAKKDDYIFVKLMRLSPNDYYRAKIYYEVFFYILSYPIA